MVIHDEEIYQNILKHNRAEVQVLLDLLQHVRQSSDSQIIEASYIYCSSLTLPRSQEKLGGDY